MKKELVIPTDEDSIKWAELYRRYNKILYCMAIKDTKNKQDAEDALHQAFSKISQHLDKIDDPASRSAFNYCLTIMRNVIRDSYRKQSRHPEVELDEKYIEFLEKREFEEVEDIVFDKLDFEKITICARSLKSPYKESFNLYYYNGYSIESISEVLGVRKETISMRIHRAKLQIKDMLRKEGEKLGK